MHPPYLMVLVNLIISAITLIIVLFYLKFIAKNKVNYLYLLLLISILPLVSLLREGTYESGDMTLHAMRAISFHSTLFHEFTLPRWAAELNLGYGEPYFQFIYFLPYFLISFFHFIGFSFIASTKLLLALSYLASGFFMYLWAKEEFGKLGGFTGAIFYLFAPYHLLDMHFRVTIAENLSFLFLPLILLLIKKHFDKKNTFLLYIGIALTISLFILSHQPTFLTSLPLIVIYSIFKWQKSKNFKKLLLLSLSIIFGFIYSAFFWIPIIAEARYIHQSILNNVVTFYPLSKFLFSPWRLGFLFQGPYGELAFIIGYTQLFVLGVCTYLLIARKITFVKQPFIYRSIILFAFYLFMTQSISAPIWNFIPYISNLQFSYRLMVQIVFLTSVMAAALTTIIRTKKTILIICFITIIYTVLNWGNRGMVPYIDDNFLKNHLKYGPTITGKYEPTAPIWVDPNKISFTNRPKKHMEIISGSGEIIELNRKSTNHEYIINASSNLELKENTFYFPGWVVLVNNKPYKFTYNNKEYPGIIIFNLGKGQHHVSIKFTDTNIRSYSFWISVFSVIITLIIVTCSILKKFIAKIA